MNVSSKQLSAFVFAAKLRSFSKAAERLHITPAGLSFSIRELEAQVGSKLLERTTRSVSLTEAGERFLPVAERVVNELQSALLQVNEVETRIRSTIRLGANPLICSKIVPPAYKGFHRENPHVKLQVVELQLDAIHDLVISGELDIGFGIFLESKVGIERTRMFSSRLYLVSPVTDTRVTNPLSRITQVRWENIRATPLIGLPPLNPFQQLIDRNLPVSARNASDNMVVNHIETQIGLAEIGVGSAIIPSFALSACRHSKVRIQQLVAPVVDVDFFRISRKGATNAPHYDAFTASMIEVASRANPA